jgi:hypothetical protein
VAEAKRREAQSVSLYVVETASDAELAAFAEASRGGDAPVTAEALQAAALAYVRGGIAILDHGTPTELRAWGRLFGGRE